MVGCSFYGCCRSYGTGKEGKKTKNVWDLGAEVEPGGRGKAPKRRGVSDILTDVRRLMKPIMIGAMVFVLFQSIEVAIQSTLVWLFPSGAGYAALSAWLEVILLLIIVVLVYVAEVESERREAQILDNGEGDSTEHGHTTRSRHALHHRGTGVRHKYDSEEDSEERTHIRQPKPAAETHPNLGSVIIGAVDGYGKAMYPGIPSDTSGKTTAMA